MAARRVCRELACEGAPALLTAWLEGERIVVEVAEQLGFRLWRNAFDAECVQLLTTKTGCAKALPVFWRMLAAAVEAESDTVSVSLLSSAQVEEMRARSGKPAKAAADNRYLILSYEGEFDAVNYPLILLPGVEERPEALRQVITRLLAARPAGGEIPALAENLRAELLFEQRERERQSENHRKELAKLLERVEALAQEKEKLQTELQRMRTTRRPPIAAKPFVLPRPTKMLSKASNESTKRRVATNDFSRSSLSKISRSSSKNSVRSSSLKSAQKVADSFLRRKQKLALLCGPARPPRPASFSKQLPQNKYKPKTVLK